MTKRKKTSRPKPKLSPFDKYHYYSASVQSPDEDAKFLDTVYRNARGKSAKAVTLREDFCGTFLNCCSWVKLGGERRAVGVDLDPEPIGYGRANNLSKLTPAQQKRVQILQDNVLSPGLPPADVIAALNFSFFIFKQRRELLSYFRNALATLAPDGIFVLDCFGGSNCYEPNEEETEYDESEFSYFWDQDSYDPVTNEAMFYIHFKRKGEPKREKVFVYDWRMWSIPELRDLLYDAGFKRVQTYWEGTTEDGEGDGEFTAVEKGEDCESWVSYIVACK